MNAPPFTYPRLTAWGRKHGLETKLISRPIRNHPLPHFEKLAVPSAFPGYDRYIVCDDDLLLSRHAPPPPVIPVGDIGMVPDTVQRLTRASHVEWTGNTDFLVVDAAAADLCENAINCGPTPDIWGIADQGALNEVGWRAGRLHRLDARWNYMPIIETIEHHVPWEKWIIKRHLRIACYLRLINGVPPHFRKRVKTSWGIHLV